MQIRDGLIEEFNSELEEVSKMEVGSEAHEKAVNAVTKLADRIIEIDKIEMDSANKIEAQQNEFELKAQEIKSEKNSRMIGYCVTAGTTVVGVLVTVGVYLDSMRREAEGIMPSSEAARSSSRNLLNLFKLKF